MTTTTDQTPQAPSRRGTLAAAVFFSVTGGLLLGLVLAGASGDETPAAAAPVAAVDDTACRAAAETAEKYISGLQQAFDLSSAGVLAHVRGETTSVYRATEELENLVPVVQQRRSVWETQYEKCSATSPAS